YWEQWKHELLRGLREQFERHAQSEDLGQKLFGEEVAKGFSLVEVLGGTYDVVVTNPPYAGSGNLDARYKAFLDGEYSGSRANLFSAFIQRCHDFAAANGRVGLVTQQAWLSLISFSLLRASVL